MLLARALMQGGCETAYINGGRLAGCPQAGGSQARVPHDKIPGIIRLKTCGYLHVGRTVRPTLECPAVMGSEPAARKGYGSVSGFEWTRAGHKSRRTPCELCTKERAGWPESLEGAFRCRGHSSNRATENAAARNLMLPPSRLGLAQQQPVDPTDQTSAKFLVKAAQHTCHAPADLACQVG